MSSKNITKNAAFVTIFLTLIVVLVSCSAVSSHDNGAARQTREADSGLQEKYGAPQILATIKSDEITESSGIAASRCNAEVLWTHNDSGDGNYIYALDTKGKKLGTFRVTGAKNVDWEDIATRQTSAGECFLYIGDTGNNELDRETLTIYKVKEPLISEDNATHRADALPTDPAETIKIVYPDKRHNAETLMIHPATGDIYVVTKEFGDPADVYKLVAKYDPDATNKLEKVSTLTVPSVPYGLLTGGDIAPDGKSLVICDYFAAYELKLPANKADFDEIWKQKPTKINLGERKQGEAIAYSPDGNSFYATSEKKNSPLIMVNKK